MISGVDIEDMKPTRYQVVEEIASVGRFPIHEFETWIEAENCRMTYHNSIEGNFKIIEV